METAAYTHADFMELDSAASSPKEAKGDVKKKNKKKRKMVDPVEKERKVRMRPLESASLLPTDCTTNTGNKAITEDKVESGIYALIIVGTDR